MTGRPSLRERAALRSDALILDVMDGPNEILRRSSLMNASPRLSADGDFQMHKRPGKYLQGFGQGGAVVLNLSLLEKSGLSNSVVRNSEGVATHSLCPPGAEAERDSAPVLSLSNCS